MTDVNIRALEGFHDGGTRMHKHQQGVMPQARAHDLARAGLVSIGPEAAAPKQAPVPRSNKMLPEPAAPAEAPAAPGVPPPAPPLGSSSRPAPRSTKAARLTSSDR